MFNVKDFLVKNIDTIPTKAQPILALFSSKRLYLTGIQLGRNSKEYDAVNTYINYLKECICGMAGNAVENQQYQSAMIDIIPDESEYPEFHSSVLEDTISAAIFTGRSIYEDVTENVTWAILRSYDTADRLASQAINNSEYTEVTEAIIFGQPIVQQEILRLKRDFAEISTQGPVNNRNFIENSLTARSNESILKIT